MIDVPFNKPYMTGKELAYIAQAHRNSALAGNGRVYQGVPALAREPDGSRQRDAGAFLYRGTGNVGNPGRHGAGDEVIMPSFHLRLHGEMHFA